MDDGNVSDYASAPSPPAHECCFERACRHLEHWGDVYL